MEYVLEQVDAVEFEPIPAGEILEAVVENVEERETRNWVDENDPSKGKRKRVSFFFRITQEGPYEGRAIFGSTSNKFSTHPNCRLRVWVQEILGVDNLPENFRFTEDDLIGQPVKVVVDNYESTQADGSVVTKDSVSDVIRVGEVSFAGDLY